MEVDDFAAALFLNALIWAGAYKLSQDMGSDLYLIAGWAISVLYTLSHAYRRERHKSAFRCLSDEALERELRRLANEAKVAIDAAAEAKRLYELGHGKGEAYERAEARRINTLLQFTTLQRAAMDAGNSYVKATLRDYLYSQ